MRARATSSRQIIGAQGLFLALLVLGCGSSPVSSPVSVAPIPNVTGNWQIQSGVPVANPTAGVLLVGALQSSAGTVSGTFRFSNLAQPTTCGLDQVIALSGTVDAKGNMTLTSGALASGSTVKVQLALATPLTSFASGTIEVDGGSCAFAGAAGIGAEVAPVDGTFAGTLTPGTLLSPGTGAGGTASIALTQSPVAGADGQFPVTGVLTYAFGTCMGSRSLTGTVSGVGITLAPVVTPVAGLPTVNFFGFATNTGSQINGALLSFLPAPCSADLSSSASYSGTLARQ